MKRFLLWPAFLSLAYPCSAALVPYLTSLDRADAVAIVTVTSCEESYHDGLIFQSATLTVDTAIKGIAVGEKFSRAFGVPYEPAKIIDGRYTAKRTLHSEGFSFQIAERHLVLLQKGKDGWVVTRQSVIIDDMIGDAYFEDFAGSSDVSVSMAIELLKTHKKARPAGTARRP